MTTITDAFELPRPEDIRAMGFVVKLRELDPNSEEVEQLARDYVVTPAVEKELPRILDDMKQVFDRGEEYGRFIHGSFGSGKSHFMTMLSLLVEGAPPAWKKFRPLLNAHRDAKASKGGEASDHEAWLTKAGLLVVRIHMLSVRGKSTGFDRAVYEGLNAALKRRGKAPFEFLNVDAIFEEVRREAKEYGEVVWKRLETEGIVGGRDDFEALAAGSIQAKERFARAWLKYKGRDASDAGIDPRWSEGLKRMAEHAKAQGFGGIVLMIDEFLLWLAEKSGQEFVAEINNLNVIVDHNTGQRPAPVFVFVARQRNLQEFFPDLVDESKIHEHLDHHAKRFELTKLQDVELRHIVRGRVLRPKKPDEVKAAVSSLSEKHSKVLPALLAGSDLDYLRDVYPFHPALIEMLVDVTSLMQRERSALRLLYELLVVHYPKLPLGEFLPVGSAFSAIFPESGVEASKKVELMQDIHHQYYSRLAPAMAKMAEEGGAEFNDERRRALDQLVKTVLLAEVSPRLKQGGLTIERLVQLNAVDVEGETFRGQVRVAETDLLALSQRVPDLQVAGQGKTALVRYVLGRVSLGEILGRARSKVDNPAQRFKVFWLALREALGVAGTKGFEDGGPNEGDWDLPWRRTRRRGRIKLGNVREMSYDDFAPPDGAFKILIDYPWDEPGHTVDEDRLRATNVRKKQGLLHTVCWLPRHMSPTELGVLTELAAVRYLLSDAGQEDLLETLGPQDKSKVLDQAGIRQKTLEGQLEDLLKEVYVRHGEFFALISDVDSSRPRETLAENLEHIAALLMDRRYPQHPTFLAEPKKQDLESLLGWMVDAGEGSVSVAYDENVGKVLKNLGQPLELVNLGQTKASLRLDSRYIKDVLQRADQDSVSWAPIADHLRETYGFQPLLVDLFLCFLCQRDHRALEDISGEPADVRIGMSQTTRIRLQRGKLVSAADWHRLRDLGSQLLEVPRPAAHRSLQGQDRFTTELRTRGQARRTVLQALHTRLVHLGVEGGDRLRELSTANSRLGPLAQTTTDSHKVLSELLASWPDDASDALRTIVHEAETLRDALAELNEHARGNLKAGVSHPIIGSEVRGHLGALDSRLAAAQAEQPLTKDWVATWNKKAQELIKRLIEQPRAPQPPAIGDGAQPSNIGGGARPSFTGGGPEVTPRTVLLKKRVNPADADAIEDFLIEVRKALTEQGVKPISVALVRTEELE
ncbi:hypothetical protein D7X96_08775 [Corallococcus interemptor]|uniref:BREX system P-loop protein BrxC n=1 Tax=Corallococcus interemptor TaxID=2316720 RepID=A0A3A8R2G0_9BACT|nr:DUF6079 family protein [Corallococcus interemptor]RKH71352.1 hypothetical protein D7X96_08775 [Corallococcus interemptor]